LHVAGFALEANEHALQNSAWDSTGGAAHVAPAPPSPVVTWGLEELLHAPKRVERRASGARVREAKFFMGAVQ
jgi:hypothetical protein